jgi:hypothetical protein
VPAHVERVENRLVPRAHTGDENGDPAVFEPTDGVTQHRGAAGRVDRAHAGHPQDHHRQVRDLGEFEQEAGRRAEEQRAIEPVGDDVLVHEGAFLRAALTVERHLGVERLLLNPRGSGHCPQREHSGRCEPEATAVTRSRATVTPRVNSSTAASALVDRRRALIELTSIM